MLRTILLLDSEYEPDKEKRIDKAFRKLGDDPKDLELFDNYVLGGVEVLHEKLIEGVTDKAEYVNRLYDFIDDFNDRFNEDINNEEILAICNTSLAD